MNTGAINTAQHSWPLPNQWPKSDDNESLASVEKQELAKNIEKEEGELKRISQELSEHLSKGEQDLAKLKSTEIAQKQMQIQAMRSQMNELAAPKHSSSVASPVTSDTANRAKFDHFVKSSDKPAEATGIYHLETDDSGNQKIILDSLDARSENPPDKDGGESPNPSRLAQIDAEISAKGIKA